MVERIRLAEVADFAAWQASLRAQIADNGRDGVYFTTVLEANAAARFTPQKLAEIEAAGAKGLSEPGWIRVFVLEDDGVIVGHADLRGGNREADLHRCTLGLGLARAYQGRGLGEALMHAALAWAREAGLAWMDLAVFGGNERARRLYLKLGFVEVGRVADRFRMGTSVDEILMTRDLTSR